MKAQEVLRRYAEGERDFQGANLRGANFKGKDLSGANFSKADIRSANFTNAVLRNVNFTGAQAGLQKRWVAARLALVFLISFLAGILQALASIFTVYLSDSTNFISLFEHTITTGIFLLLISTTYLSIAIRGFSSRAFGIILPAFAVTCVIAGVFSAAGAIAGTVIPGTVVGAVASATTLAVLGAVVGAVLVALAVAVAVIVSAVGGVAGIISLAFAALVAGLVAAAVGGITAGVVAVTGLLFSLFIRWRVLKEDEKFDTLKIASVALSTIGGTSFRGANLTSASFHQACLASTNFAWSKQQLTDISYVNWQNAKQLNSARLGASILRDRRVRTLLDGSQSGYKINLSNVNLRSANLTGLTLEKANLTRAVLSGARLHKTMLEGATLTEAQAIGADFTGAYLTGARLEGWNIDSTTVLEDIDCRYVFLLEKPNENGDQERRPHDLNKIFQPGDFEKFFKEMVDEFQILIRDADPIALRIAFEKLKKDYPAITQRNIQGFEWRGADILLKLKIPEGIQKADVERILDEGYQVGLREGRNIERLEGTLPLLERITLLEAGKNITVTAIAEAMNQDQSQNIDVKGNFTVTANNSVISLRDISGQVNNQIASLSDDPVQTQLKDLLTQLTTAIQAEPTLSEEQKTEALEEVKELAAAGQAPQDGPMKKAAKRAITVLKGMTIGLGETTKFVEACNGLLPAIGALFSL